MCEIILMLPGFMDIFSLRKCVPVSISTRYTAASRFHPL